MDHATRRPDDTPPVSPDQPVDADLACRLANLDWHYIASRWPYRSHIVRIKALEAAGLVADETTFPGAAVAS